MGRTWRFADFEFSTARGLERDGAVIALQPKARGLLELLLRADGATVSKEAVAAALWLSETVSDDSIARVVYQLRKALGDAGPAVLRTVYGEGSQLTCPIQEDVRAGPPPGDSASAVIGAVNELAASRTSVAMAQAKETLRFAIGRNPDFAAAWVHMADCVAVQAWRGFIAPETAALEIAEACARALSIDPRNAGAIAVSGWGIALLSGRVAEGRKRLDLAVAMAPGAWLIRYYRAWLRALERDLTAALAEAEAAVAANPLDRRPIIMHILLKLFAGETGCADALAIKAQKLRPDVATLFVLRSIAAGVAGNARRALALVGSAADISPRDPFTVGQLAYAYAKTGDIDKARSALDLAMQDAQYSTPALLAAPMLALGERAGARRLLERAEARHCPWRAFAWCDPRLKPLHSTG